MSNVDKEEGYECILREFTKIINEEDLNDNKELSTNTKIKLQSDIIINNIPLILCGFIEIDDQTKEINFFWTKYNIYNFIFSREFYNSVKSKFFVLKNFDVVNNHEYKYLLYGGITCEIVKNFHYKKIISGVNKIEYYNVNIDNTSNNIDISVCNGLKDLIISLYDDNILFIQELYNDVIAYYSNDKEYCYEIKDLIINNNIQIR